MGEPDKACDWMVQAAQGVNSDKFLVSQLFSQELRVPSERLPVLYFLKVIELFQQFGYFDFVIELAKTAIDICDEEDPNRVMKLMIRERKKSDFWKQKKLFLGYQKGQNK